MHVSFPLPAMGLITERIHPLPKVARQALIDNYCPANQRKIVQSAETNRDCLARLYLGHRRPVDQPLSANFTLRNFNLCLGQMTELKLPVRNYARAIGEALAIMYWSANVDGYDVESVLGSESDESYPQPVWESTGLTPESLETMLPHTNWDAMMTRRTTRIWVLDFNSCTRWKEEVCYTHPDEVISQLVIAFFENDPYYPRPLAELPANQELWNEFSSMYLTTANDILNAKDSGLGLLPQKFIHACVSQQQENLSKTMR